MFQQTWKILLDKFSKTFMQMIECFFITRFIYLFNTWSVELFFWINI